MKHIKLYEQFLSEKKMTYKGQRVTRTWSVFSGNKDKVKIMVEGEPKSRIVPISKIKGYEAKDTNQQ